MAMTLGKPKSQSLPPLDDHPEYRPKVALVNRLKTELNAKSSERTQLLNRKNSTAHKSVVEVLSAQYLEGTPTVDARFSLDETITSLSNHIRALVPALEQAEKEERRLRIKVSIETAEEQKGLVREHARTVLQGLLLIQQGNKGIERLCQARKDLGYTEYFHPVGLSDWNEWGNMEDSTSRWSMMLREFLEAGYITTAEHHRLTHGGTTL
ncbi:MAG: hypothetical protein CV090_14815 [Nitrospira sp. WS238]|nr:hypothetical protein [Nitrospira sp. WS238]